MDYLEPEIKRKHTRQLYIGYALMAVLIGLGTVILVLLAHGYSFDRSTGSVIQNGLLFVDVRPADANVFVNGELSGRGKQRQVLPDGGYTIDIRADGYRPWHKEFELAGGSVERFSYPFLFPEQLTRSTYRSFAQAPHLVTTSPDRRQMLIQEADDLNAFVSYNLDEQINLPAFFSLPVGIMSAQQPDSELELVEWANDNRHLIIKHSFGDSREFILLDTKEPRSSQNLSSRFSDIPFSDISLIDRQYDEYHLFNRSSGTLISAELEANNTEVILRDVVTYRSHGAETILFVRDKPESIDTSNADEEIRFGVYLYHDEVSRKLTTVPTGDLSNYLLDIARFSDSWYAVVGNDIEERAMIYKDPFEKLRDNDTSPLLPKYTLRTDGLPERVSFSDNARNIMLQAANEFAVYDLERERAYQYTFGGKAISRAHWMDGHRILASWDNTLHVVDFDGENKQELTSCGQEYRPMFDNNYEFLYCIAPSEQDSVFGILERSAMTAKEDL